MCVRAWYADGNTCHELRGATCAQTFSDWMDVALCQCQVKGLSNAWETKNTRVVSTTTPCPTNYMGLGTVTLTMTTTTTKGAFVAIFPWWLGWVAFVLYLLGVCGAILFLCFRRQPKPPPEEEELELLIKEGTQTASDRALHMQQFQRAATSMVQPLNNLVEVMPQPAAVIQDTTTIQPTVFDMIDSNHDGVITREELLAAASALPAQAHTQSYVIQEPVARRRVLPSEPILGPMEPIRNRLSHGPMHSTMPVQGVPTVQTATETQVLRPMQAVQERQMDLLTVTPWGYSISQLVQ